MMLKDWTRLRVWDCPLVAERCALLSAAEHKVQFLGVQLELLDDFRLRLLQVYRSLSGFADARFYPLMNAVWYIASTLQEWDYLPFYATLQKLQSANTSTGPFTGIASLYQLLWGSMRDNLVQHALLHEFGPLLDAYARHKWWAATDYAKGAPVGSGLSAALCPFLVQLRQRLGTMELALCQQAYLDVAGKLTERVAALIVDRVLLVGDFSVLGGLQLACDMHDGLVPLLRAYSATGASGAMQQHHDLGLYSIELAKLIECVKVLALSTASATLLSNAGCPQATMMMSSDETKCQWAVPHHISAGDVDELSQTCDVDVGLISLDRLRKLLARRVDLHHN